MALDPNVCGTAVWNAINSMTGSNKENTELVWQTVMTEIFSHIAANAQVAVITDPGQVLSTPDTINGATTLPGTGTGIIS